MKFAQKTLILILLLGVVILRCPVYAEPSSSPDYIEKLRHKAEQGDAEAQYRLGRLYDEHVYHDQSVNYMPKGVNEVNALFDDKHIPLGEYPVRNYQEALKWYLKAANQGNADAQYYLGRLYSSDHCGPDWIDYFGSDNEPNFVEAYKWFEKAALKNHAESQYCLAYILIERKSTAQNDSKAYELLQKAVKQNIINAKILLGHLYYEGRGVVQNYSLAASYYREAIKLNEGCGYYHYQPSLYMEAYVRLGNMYYSGSGVPKDYTEALKWYAVTVAPGNSSELYEFYPEHGKESSIPLKNYPVALERSREAAKKGNAKAQLYHDRSSNCFDRSSPECKAEIKSLLKSAEQGNVDAQCVLGENYENGVGVQRTVSESVKWYSRAAKVGSVGAWIQLKRLAIDLLYPEAQFAIGQLFADGCHGVEKNEANALKLFQMAADQGYEPAKQAIENMKGRKQ